MVLATVPEAPPTIRNQRATSCPAPISAKEPNAAASRLRASALRWLSSFSGQAIVKSPRTRFVPALLLPASAERPVKLHQTLVFGAARACECELSRKKRTLAVQNFEIGGRA